MIIWCDLILSDSFKIPDIEGNFIGLTNEFECRWHYTNEEYVQEHSKKNGIAGLFVFEDKSYLKNIPESGALVPFLKKENFKFQTFELNGAKEIGTILSYKSNENVKNKCRPFNEILEEDEFIIKRAITPQGQKIAQDEINWYKFIQQHNYPYIPKIYEYEPLKLQKIQGDNVFKYKNFTYEQKKELLSQIVNVIKELHDLEDPIVASDEDCLENYLDKTFARIDKVQNLIPFARDKNIIINGKSHKNIFFLKDELRQKINQILPKEFRVIHGDITFSNIMLENGLDVKPLIILFPEINTTLNHKFPL